ncbi:MAG: T9SS type A sorting domain-containing protein [Saprospiraceae bacterium]
MKKSLISLILFAFSATISFTQPGTPDPAFGGDGLVTTTFSANSHAVGKAAAVQPDGKIVVAGDTWVPGTAGSGRLTLLRYLPNGDPDNTFNGSGKLTATVANMGAYSQALAIQPDGKIIAAGAVNNNTQSRIALFRFNADGSPDNAFDVDGVVTTDVGTTYQSLSALALQPDGKIIVGGYAGNANEPFDQFLVVRYKPNGMLDNTFDGDGIAITSVGDAYTDVNSVMVQPDGKIIAAGYAGMNGFEDFAAVRYNANGTLDQSFNGSGIVITSFTSGDDGATGAVLQPDGKIVLGGYAGSGTPDPEFAAARFDANGFLDNTFHGDGMATAAVSTYSDGARAIILQPDGKVVLGGYAHSNIPSGGSDFALVRFTTNGIPDFTFDGDGIAIYPASTSSDFIYGLAMQPDGKIVASGNAINPNSAKQEIAVARFFSGLTVGTADLNTSASNISLYPNPVAEQAMLEYELAVSENVEINLYNIQGRFIQNILPSTEKPVGKHTETLLFASDLPPGTYLLTIETKSGITAIEAIF